MKRALLIKVAIQGTATWPTILESNKNDTVYMCVYGTMKWYLLYTCYIEKHKITPEERTPLSGHFLLYQMCLLWGDSTVLWGASYVSVNEHITTSESDISK